MSVKRENYCSLCGSELEMQYNDTEHKYVPFCNLCGEYRFPSFDTAVVMIILNTKKDKMLMVNQFSEKRYYFVSGYIDKGESAEEAVQRETKEEVGLNIISSGYIGTHYYPPSNTLMLGYWITVDENIIPVTNEEIDGYKWFDLNDNIDMHPLAAIFLNQYKEL